MSRRVVITGVGMITPLGHTVETTWENIKAGVSGVDLITRYDTSNHTVKIAAEVKNWDATQYMPAKETRRRDLYQQFIEVAMQELLRESGFEVDKDKPHRTGVIVGSAVGGVTAYYNEAATFITTGDPRRITPFGIPMLMVEGGGNQIAIHIGAMGASYAPISACATGADCIGHAFDLIRMGRLDQAIAGCGEAPIIPIGIAAFDRTGACSRLNETPKEAVKPFDKNRQGLVFSEGAALLALEELEHAKARGAKILGELVGYASTSDAFHITAPDPEAKGAALVVQAALDDARLTPDDIDYINAHGTATSLNDAMETKAIKRVFGERAYRVPMSSTKSMTGHAMGATAAMEAVFALMALRDQIAPPTINYQEPDPECDLDCVPNVAREMPIRHVMSNSFGFGGHNVSLIFSRFND
ncbi:MAG: beta-ketoacyl-[acyl-carrier-protein] synthase II [Phototrophicales bacterium]|nr:MAG: beta-ketoacyl-[acyl-carrier-protein] synthase II [Phototrophicales bacterium]